MLSNDLGQKEYFVTTYNKYLLHSTLRVFVDLCVEQV